ncbi:MAG: ATP-binding cassette domain-containing protein [Clostridium sp.]|jgi:ABC-2 type transport system ATP-binding protein|nr:ATP-binding cassette domain-containing protein [Clostridium sp.]
MKISIQNISKKYGKKTAVHKVSLDLGNGIYGLIGANGAGKTTLMNMICGVTNPSEGKIYLDGKEVSGFTRQYRALLGYLPQSFGCDNTFTVDDYLDYMLCLKGISGKKEREAKERLLTELNLKKYRTDKVCRLSGGTKRRVGVAQALLGNPMILVFDEPTAGLDPGERAKMRQLIAGMGTDRIVLLSTHIVSDIENIATCNLFMKDGELVATGSTDQLISGLEGKVWSVLQENGGDVPKVNGEIINIHPEANHKIKIRYFGQADPERKATREPANLEDVYFCYAHEHAPAYRHGSAEGGEEG